MSNCAVPEALSAVLALLQVDAVRHYGNKAARLVPVEYQDRQFSHVLRVAVHDDGASEPFSHLFVKLTKPKTPGSRGTRLRDRVIRDFDATTRVHSFMAAHHDLGVVPPVACYPEHLAIVTEQVSGPTLQAYLRRHAAWFPSAETLSASTSLLETAGRWIRTFQASMSVGGAVRLDEVREYVDYRLKKLVAAYSGNFTEGQRQGVLKHVDTLSNAVSGAELNEVAVHSDLALGNILVDGRRIVVLDFGMTKTGCRLTDVTRLYVQIELLALKPHIRRGVIRHLLASLLKGFAPDLRPEDPLFRLFVLRHRINHLLTLLEDGSTGVSGAYSRYVCRSHYRWLHRELAAAALATEPV